MSERRPTNSELRLARLTEQADETPRGILELFAEPDEDPADADAALTREDEKSERR